MRRHIKDAAIMALAIVIIKLAFRLIPPAKGFYSLFEMGIWVGMGIILTTYIIIFVIIFLILVLTKEKKVKER